jgi:hypothetical protein
MPITKPIITAEQILLYGNRQSRLIHLEANVIGYFGHIFRKASAKVRCPPKGA